MSLIGIIVIPGMMTGKNLRHNVGEWLCRSRVSLVDAILDDSSVQQGARLQMVIMFMISASIALASTITTTTTLAVVRRAQVSSLACEELVLQLSSGWGETHRAELSRAQTYA
ncbi:hypothetical protein F4604DRAFT_1099157 [Suillus subluteus]|nr:hypothetical protein F4604DRAFT_1099157 [Suillus subluteus]